MALSTLRDTTVVLIDYTNFTVWNKQFGTKCDSLKVWKLADPESTVEPLPQPTMPLPPLISEYQPSNAFRTEFPDTSPTRISQLSTTGKATYKEDADHHKYLIETYKLAERQYTLEQTNIKKIVAYLQSTVSMHVRF